MELTAGTVVANRFRLVRQLGEGGMGAVWFAHHTGLDTPCAIKFIHAEVVATPGVKARFEREAKIAAQLRSPHVVQVLDYGLSDGIPYLAMEFLDGEDLAQRLTRLGRLPPTDAVAVVSQVARALTKAHAAGLVHRDLKPENVYIVRDDDTELVKVLDFGIAKSQTPHLDGRTRTGAILGTPHYMSPEQAQGTKTVDHRSDLWALGVIAFRALVGRLPFESDALGDLLMRIIVHPLPVPSQLSPGLPASFDAWWTRAAARDADQRFQNAKELAESFATSLGLSPSFGAATPMVASGRTPVASAPGFGPTYPVGGTPAPVAYPTPGPVPSGPWQEQAPALHTPAPSSGGPVSALTPAPTHVAPPHLSHPGMPPPQSVPLPQTLGAATHTYGGAERGGGSGRGKILALVAFMALFGVGGAGFAVARWGAKGDVEPEPIPIPVAASTAPAATATATPTATATAGATDEPTVTPTATATAATAAPARPLPVRPVARPPVKPPPPPARTGKVIVAPPQP